MSNSNALKAEEEWNELAERKARYAQAVAGIDAHAAKWAAKESLEAANVAMSFKLERETGVPHCSCKTPPHPMKEA